MLFLCWNEDSSGSEKNSTFPYLSGFQELRGTIKATIARFWKLSLDIEVFLGQLEAMAYSVQGSDGPEKTETLSYCCYIQNQRPSILNVVTTIWGLPSISVGRKKTLCPAPYDHFSRCPRQLPYLMCFWGWPTRSRTALGHDTLARWVDTWAGLHLSGLKPWTHYFLPMRPLGKLPYCT